MSWGSARWGVVCLVAAVSLAGCKPWTKSGMQREFAQEELVPQGLVEEPRPSLLAAPTKLRVRALADASFREMSSWRREIEVQIDLANALLERYGIVLELTGIHDWERAGSSDDIGEALAELERTEPGDRVDLVIGFTTPLPLVTAAIHRIAVARSPGRHIVMRGLDDVQELNALRASLDALNDEDLMHVYQERKRHKQRVVMVHEVAHALGVIHARERSSVMSPSWSIEGVGLSPAEVALLQLGLRYHRRSDALAEWQAERAALLRASTWDGWDPGERAALVGADSIPSDKAATAPPASGFPSAVVPAAVAVPRLAAAPLAPVPRGATDALSIARDELAAGRLSAAERALAQVATSAESRAVAESIERVRREVALPPRALPEAAEAAYVASMRTALAAAFRGDAKAAEAVALDLERQHAAAPGAPTIRCAAAYQGQNAPLARSTCATALSRHPGAVVPRYFTALMRASRHSTREAERDLTAMTESDPWFNSPWASLAEMLRHRRASAELDALAARYRAARGADPSWAAQRPR